MSPPNALRHKYPAEYETWRYIRQKCLNPDNSRYTGDKICRSWWLSFEYFFSDLGPRPSPQHKLARYDKKKEYGPDNCYWRSLESNQDRVYVNNIRSPKRKDSNAPSPPPPTQITSDPSKPWKVPIKLDHRLEDHAS